MSSVETTGSEGSVVVAVSVMLEAMEADDTTSMSLSVGVKEEKTQEEDNRRKESRESSCEGLACLLLSNGSDNRRETTGESIAS